MKKTMIILGVMMLVLVTGCSQLVVDAPNEADGSGIKVEDIANSLSPEEVMAKIDNKESFAFVIGNDGCPACQAYKIQLKEFYEKEDIKLDYINLDDKTDMKKMEELLVEKLDADVSKGISTPTTYFIVEGVPNEPVIGPISADEMTTKYIGFVK